MSKHPSSSSAPAAKVKKTYNLLTEKEKKYILECVARGESTNQIAISMGRSPATIYAFLKKNKQRNVTPDDALELSMSSEPETSDGDDFGVFRDYLEHGGYSHKQVLSFQETGLVWNMMSQLTSGSGFQANRVTLIIGGNAEGDWKLKPLLVYHTENPRALKGYIKEHFPVIWKAHPQVTVRNDFLQSYVVGYLSPACTEYAIANNIPDKFLLILDNQSAHLPSMKQWAENIEVLFLPFHMQPMDQGVVDIFKRYYHRRVMHQLVKAIPGDDTTPEEFWKQYNIKKAIHNISHSWNQVEQPIMNVVWDKLWPDAVSDFWKFQDVAGRQQQLTSDIVRLSHRAGMTQVNAEGIEVLLASHAEVPSDEEQAQLESESGDPDPSQQTQGLNKDELKKLLDAVSKASAIAENQDLNMSRSDMFSQALECAAMRYQKMYDDL